MIIGKSNSLKHTTMNTCDRSTVEDLDLAKKFIPELIRQGIESVPDGNASNRIKITVTVKFKPLEVGVSVEF